MSALLTNSPSASNSRRGSIGRPRAFHSAIAAFKDGSDSALRNSHSFDGCAMIWPVASVTMVDAGKSRVLAGLGQVVEERPARQPQAAAEDPGVSPEAPVTGIVKTMTGSPETRDINAFEISGRFAAIVFRK